MVGTVRCDAGPERSNPGASSCAWGPTPDEFRMMIEPLIDPLVAVARRIAHCDHMAHDAVQEALISLWREPERPQSLRGWLVQAVTHRALHLMRSQSRRRKHERFACERCREESLREDASAGLEAGESIARLRAAIDQLPRDFGEVIRLRAFEELDYDAIARRLSVPTGTVRSRLSRARTALERILAQPA